jgi:hypothetical protein
MPARLRRPCDERLAEDLGPLEAPVHPGFLATPFRAWCTTGVVLACIGGGIAFTVFTNRAEAAGGTDRPSAWPGVKQGEGGRARGRLGDRFLEVCAPPQGDTALGAEGLPQEGMGRDAACSAGQGAGTLEGLAA